MNNTPRGKWFAEMTITPPNELIAEIKKGNTDNARLLIEGGTDVNKLCWYYGDEPLTVAIREHNKEIVELLLKHGVKVDAMYMYNARRHGNQEILNILQRKLNDQDSL